MEIDMKILRWQEMPNFEIYSDQLITIVNQELAFMKIEVTNSMINNYVKHKVMPLPVKKKYGQVHIAYLIMISLLKSTFSMEEIKQYFQNFPIEKEYDKFCDIFWALWQKDKIDLGQGPTGTADDLQLLSGQINYLMAATIISKFRATNLLAQKGENHAATTSQ
ncbi:DUF1836 domain-containing protein [Clostridiales bacterium COT073_COT-073]|nr:DUF1836 domain-containing protein [Clostridiales bacterium COT073_COT-073]